MREATIQTVERRERHLRDGAASSAGGPPGSERRGKADRVAAAGTGPSGKIRRSDGARNWAATAPHGLAWRAASPSGGEATGAVGQPDPGAHVTGSGVAIAASGARTVALADGTRITFTAVEHTFELEPA